MQAPKNQRKYYCPLCEKEMEVEESSGYNSNQLYTIICVNEDCDGSGVGWDIQKLESYEVNKIRRVEELIGIE